MEREYEQFLQLFLPQPGYKVLDVTSHADELTRIIETRIQPYDGRLSLAMYPGEHEAWEYSKTIEAHDIVSFGKPFRALARDNDIVIIRDVLNRHEFPERILKIIYQTLANTGEIIIISKKGSVDIPLQLQMLEEFEFRAANSIDIFDKYDLVMAKKMHMWGNGL